MSLLTLENINITLEMAEEQAYSDFVRYQQLCNPFDFPVYPEDVITKLWGTKVFMKSAVCDSEGKPVLGTFYPDINEVHINMSAHKNEKRLNFTVAHEAGHVSLHNAVIQLGGGYSSIKTEKQADRYAGALLMPKVVFLEKMKKHGFTPGGEGVSERVIKLGTEFFNVSIFAFELRLSALNFNIENPKYPVFKKYIPESAYVSDEERSGWGS